jgi:hypothetical protein
MTLVECTGEGHAVGFSRTISILSALVQLHRTDTAWSAICGPAGERGCPRTRGGAKRGSPPPNAGYEPVPDVVRQFDGTT